jgi:hypothetical protein
MADVVALELEARAVGAELLQAALDLGEGVAEDKIPRHLEVGLLPGVLEGCHLLGRTEDAEVERAHVHRRDLGLGPFGRCQPLFERHAEPATGCDVHHRVALLLNSWQEALERLRLLCRLAIHLLARMEVQDGHACLGCFDRLATDLVGCDR